MPVTEYKSRGKKLFRVRCYVLQPDGAKRQIKQGKFPTRAMAEAFEHKQIAAGYEGRYFDKRTETKLTVAELWAAYSEKEGPSKRAWATDKGRGAHLVRHLGKKRVVGLDYNHTVKYREIRAAEFNTHRNPRTGKQTALGTHPSEATLDREVGLLRRVLNWAVKKAGLLSRNPITSFAMVRPHNERTSVISEPDFEAICDVAADGVAGPLIMLRDTAARMRDILNLKWGQVEFREGRCWVKFHARDTKEQDHRAVPLSPRCAKVIKEQTRSLDPEAFVFLNPKSGEPWSDLRSSFRWACKRVGVAYGQKVAGGITIHDIRRTSITRMRQAGVDEKVIMGISGHKTRAVFDRYNIVEGDDLTAAIDTAAAARKTRR